MCIYVYIISKHQHSKSSAMPWKYSVNSFPRMFFARLARRHVFFHKFIHPGRQVRRRRFYLNAIDAVTQGSSHVCSNLAYTRKCSPSSHPIMFLYLACSNCCTCVFARPSHNTFHLAAILLPRILTASLSIYVVNEMWHQGT